MCEDCFKREGAPLKLYTGYEFIEKEEKNNV